MWVSQGSILGPLLSVLYVNDKANTSNVLEFFLFADDTTITYSRPDAISKLHFHFFFFKIFQSQITL